MMLNFAVRNSKARERFLSFCIKEMCSGAYAVRKIHLTKLYPAENLKFMVAYQQLVEYVAVRGVYLQEYLLLQQRIAHRLERCCSSTDLRCANTGRVQNGDLYAMACALHHAEIPCITQYLAKDAPREVNISYKVKESIRESYQMHFSSGINVLCINEEKVKALEVFRFAYREVRILVLNDTWSRFSKSDQFDMVCCRAVCLSHTVHWCSVFAVVPESGGGVAAACVGAAGTYN
jgi:hypothetical protein